MPDPFYTLKDDALYLNVRVLPGARREGIDGIWNETHLKIALKAPAVDGKANEALIAFLSTYLKKRKSDIAILTGQTSRLKRVKIQNITANELNIFEKI